ncbi:hypothetical protein GCM10023152_30220 [Agromyces bauzanensis]|uniref:Uncharacterized protein n=1 Tax=Agromyces bauzanensis TaxID=1308924 RepID=A0A917PPM6_9MICO|nr:hypothetical protein GCM10011372_26330 [Agromyces bauzanensis]
MTSPTTPCSTGSARTSRSTTPAPRRTAASSTSSAPTDTPFTGIDWGFNGADCAQNPNNCIVTTAAGFPEAAVVATPGSLLTGFGFEGMTDAAMQAAWMDKALEHLFD